MSTAAAISASRNWSPWNSAIAVPNWCRSRAYAIAQSKAAWASPVAQAAMPSRPESNADRAIRIPSPSSPIRRSASNGTASRYIAAVGEAVRPILCSGLPKLTPGASAGTWKQLIPWVRSRLVRANVV